MGWEGEAVKHIFWIVMAILTVIFIILIFTPPEPYLHPWA